MVNEQQVKQGFCLGKKEKKSLVFIEKVYTRSLMASHYYHNDNLCYKKENKTKKQRTQAMLGIKSHHHQQHEQQLNI